MKQFTAAIPFQEGLHARPASELVKVCQNIKSKTVLSKGEAKCDPKSILGIMSLGAAFGDEITVSADGEDEETAIISLKNFFKA
jgi:phosphocarrier protein